MSYRERRGLADTTIAAADELMTEFISKKRACDWGVVNQAMLDASASDRLRKGGAASSAVAPAAPAWRLPVLASYAVYFPTGRAIWLSFFLKESPMTFAIAFMTACNGSATPFTTALRPVS